MKLDFDNIMNFADLNEMDPRQVIEILGTLFEESRQQKNIDLLKKVIDLSEKQKLDQFNDQEKMLFHYNLANGWSYYQKLTQVLNSESFNAFDCFELDKQIINLRLALIYSRNVIDDQNRCQILTNLGILFSHIGRFSEAQSYWQDTIITIPNFPMAIGNIGFGLVHYSKVLYDKGHQIIFLKIAYNYLTQSIKLDIYKEARLSFQKMRDSIETKISKEQLLKLPNLKNFKIGKSKKEIEYRLWCLSNRLFINPLNDICIDAIAATDCLFLPTMILKLNQPPVYQSIFNQIKQEYVSARYLLFEGINQKGVHFSDRANLQMDTLDYSSYSLSIEKIKIAFRICYSIFDKIGYLLNDYLNLNFDPDKVSFRKIWYKSGTNKTKSLNSKISKNPNWAFRGLYWLSKDLYEKDFIDLIEPDGQDLAYIRNFIEHKTFKTVEFGSLGLAGNNLSYSISRIEFERKTLKLFKLVRAAMIYVSLGINLEEKRKKEINLNPIIQIDFHNLEDSFKY